MSEQGERSSVVDPVAAGQSSDDETTTWDIAEGDELVPGYLAWDLLSRGRRFEMWIAWCRDRLVPVCVKLPRRDELTSSTIDALRREHQAASAMSHPAIPRVLAADLDAPVPFLVHEFIEGKPLSLILDDDGPFDAHDLIILGLQLAAVLRHIHHRGFVHHDLKPSNIALRGDRALVFDFDIALPIGVQRSTTKPRGTPAYMAPEQIRCQPAHPSMDLYALGVVLFEAATGSPLHVIDDGVDNGRADDQLPRRYPQIEEPPPDLTRRAPDLPAPILSVLDALLAPDPAARPADAGQVVALLEAALPPDTGGLWPAWVVPAVLG